MTREDAKKERLKMLMETGEFEFLKGIPSDTIWKLVFALGFIQNEEPCPDAISRQAVLEQLKGCLTGGETEYQYVKLHIDSIPSVKQEPITDRIEYGTDGNSYKLTISNGKEFEQEPILDKIRAEIEHIGKATPLIGTNTVIEIIDKHIAESEVNNETDN